MELDVVYNEDVVDTLKRIPDDSIDTIFADPDYNVGITYHGKRYTKPHEEYVDWLAYLSEEFHRVLKPTGNYFIINYARNNAYLQVMCLDGLFYAVHNYVWVYHTGVGVSEHKFTTAHRTILHCTKGPDNKWRRDNVAQPYQNLNDKRIKARIARGSPGRMPYSWVLDEQVKNVSHEKTNHPCQLPKDLTALYIKASTDPGDIVLIPFAGSGSEIDVCINNQRHYVAAEIDPTFYASICIRLKKDVLK